MSANKCKIHVDYPKVQIVQDKKGKRLREPRELIDSFYTYRKQSDMKIGKFVRMSYNLPIRIGI
jgi:hypothetical protein